MKDDIRELLIRMHGIAATNECFTFYYDETNNFRKLTLTDEGLNVPDLNVFVMGGVLHRGLTPAGDFEGLFDNLNLQPTIQELKFKYVAKGDFLQVLRSPKLSTFLTWIIDNDYLIHYFKLNPLYWSILDIVDSINVSLMDDSVSLQHLQVKGILYNVIAEDQDAFLSLLHHYHYPDLATGSLTEFLSEISDFVGRNESALSRREFRFLQTYLKIATDRSTSLPLIQGAQANTLMDKDFLAFYAQPVFLYTRSTHVFDEEPRVQQGIGDFLDQFEGTTGQCVFMDSRAHRCIQLSDVITGLLGKYFTYIKDHPLDVLLEHRAALDSEQSRNLRLLSDLMDYSEAVSVGFFRSVVSQLEEHKHERFLSFG